MENKFHFILTEQEANLIVSALGEVPYKMSAKLISNLQMQYQEQIIHTNKSQVEKT